MRRARSGPFIMLLRRAYAALVSFLTAVVMPHFLAPEAYGLAAMSAVLFTLGDMFKDFGMTSALMRRGTISQEEVSFLFWFNLLTTSVLAALLAASSPFVATFFHQPIVAKVILLSLIGFVLTGISLQHRMLLSRDLRFTELAVIDSVAISLQFVLTLVLAIKGYGVWAIVIGTICNAAANSILCVALTRWKPGPPRMIDDAKGILAFGANTSVYSLSVFVSVNIMAVLIGRKASAFDLGQYNRANALLSLPLNNLVEPLAQVALPVLARLRPYPGAYREAYLQFLTRLNLAVIPASIFLIAAGRPLVTAALGANWQEAGQLLMLLAPVVAALGYGYAVSDLFITQDRSRELRMVGLAESAMRVLAVYTGIQFGIAIAAMGYAAATVLAVGIRVFVAGRSGPVTFADHLATAIPALPLSVGCLLGCEAATFVGRQAGLTVTAGAVVLCAAAVLGALAAGLAFKTSRAALLSAGAILRPGRA
ncbi:MAG TPA: lipopolysaccharide biosynthesis protein [Rhizomicrobium sp.]|nr:lipopolysaccharide biosynthesis protein [Rhizomicrobium sp.]